MPVYARPAFAAAGGGLLVTALFCRRSAAVVATDAVCPVHHTEADWRKLLSTAAFDVLRDQGTEMSWSSPLLHVCEPGRFVCDGCAQPLFDTKTRFDSGTGWLFFWSPLPHAVQTSDDQSRLTSRTEVHCAKGIVGTAAGDDGGNASTAEYETVGTGTTGHAETVRVVFDPLRISHGQLLRVFFSVALDPTQTGGQYPDVGSQYRSVVFATSPDQARVAKEHVAQLDAAHPFARSIATEAVPDHGFFATADCHQNFLDLHPDKGYIATFDRPKIDALQSRLPDRFLSAPILAAATADAAPG